MKVKTWLEHLNLFENFEVRSVAVSAEHLEDEHDNARQRSERRQNLRWTQVEWVEWERAQFLVYAVLPSMPSDWIAHRYTVGVNVPMTDLQLEVFLITVCHSVVILPTSRNETQ